MSRFMDATTDFGFKKLFGEEANKDITRSFLNDLLQLESPLLDLEFPNPAQLPEAFERRSDVYDLLCRDAAGNYFLVEMQKSRLPFIKDRMLYYSTFPIAAQARKGRPFTSAPSPFAGRRIREGAAAYGQVWAETETQPSAWNYELQGIYCLAILGYALTGSKTAVNRNSIRNDRPPHELFYDKLKFVTVELPMFDERKPEYSLDLRLNKWLYFLSYLPELERMPDFYKNDKIFQKAFLIAELANFTPQERDLYEASLKQLRDTYAAHSASYETGMAKGKIEGKAEGKIEGKIEGRLEESRDLLQILLVQKLGAVPDDVAAQINTCADPESIRGIVTHLQGIADWEGLRRLLRHDHLH